MTTRPGGKALLPELYADYFKRGELVAADVDPLAVAGALRALAGTARSPSRTSGR
jgi:hypothetical protein